PASLNNLGVALFYEERSERAKEVLMLASTLDPDYAAPVFNLAVIARAEQRAAEAQRYMQRYEQITAWLTPQPPRAPQSLETLSLGSHTVYRSLVERDIPPSVDRPTRSPVVVDGTTFTVVTYPSGVMTLVLDGELIMLMAREEYQGQSVQGVGIGSRTADIVTRYGPPSRRHEMPHGQDWTYDTQR